MNIKSVIFPEPMSPSVYNIERGNKQANLINQYLLEGGTGEINIDVDGKSMSFEFNESGKLTRCIDQVNEVIWTPTERWYFI